MQTKNSVLDSDDQPSFGSLHQPAFDGAPSWLQRAARCTTFLTMTCLYLWPSSLGIHQGEKSLVLRKPVFEVLTRSETNQAVQLQKMARGLKFPIQKVEGL